MRITSLTGFSSKLARVYVMKVSFLLENRNGRGVQARRGLTGREPGSCPPPGPEGPAWGSSRGHRLRSPQTWAAARTPLACGARARTLS